MFTLFGKKEETRIKRQAAEIAADAKRGKTRRVFGPRFSVEGAQVNSSPYQERDDIYILNDEDLTKLKKLLKGVTVRERTGVITFQERNPGPTEVQWKAAGCPDLSRDKWGPEVRVEIPYLEVSPR